MGWNNRWASGPLRAFHHLSMRNLYVNIQACVTKNSIEMSNVKENLFVRTGTTLKRSPLPAGFVFLGPSVSSAALLPARPHSPDQHQDARRQNKRQRRLEPTGHHQNGEAIAEPGRRRTPCCAPTRPANAAPCCSSPPVLRSWRRCDRWTTNLSTRSINWCALLSPAV